MSLLLLLDPVKTLFRLVHSTAEGFFLPGWYREAVGFYVGPEHSGTAWESMVR